MRGYVANTDIDWYEFLAADPSIREVNFWWPSGKTRFRALAPGEPLFFRLKKPYRAIAGFGLFLQDSILPAWLAWDAFESGNGAPDFTTMRARIEKYRRGLPRDPAAQYAIGCTILGSPVFFPRDLWIKEPADWSNPIVRGKGYSLAEGEGARIWRECLERSAAASTNTLDGERLVVTDPDEEGARYGKQQIVQPRLGQGGFRIAVTDAYGRACAVTSEHSLPVLDAAHIRPYADEGTHRVENGILLRADIHRLFDRGYVTVTPDNRFAVSKRLREDWANGRIYYALDGKPIELPPNPEHHPSPGALAWHSEEIFLS